MESITGSAYTMEITKYALCPEMFTHFSSGEKINCPSLLHSYKHTHTHTQTSVNALRTTTLTPDDHTYESDINAVGPCEVGHVGC